MPDGITTAGARPNGPLACREDLATCAAMVQHGSKTFYAASHLLPRDVRQSAYALYAFCRLSDDAVDMKHEADAVTRLRHRLDLLYEGRPIDQAPDRALADVVAHHDIPAALPQALLEGLSWDTTGRHYWSLSDLYAYGARVAGSVGVMMSLLMGVRDASMLARATDLGVAMQLTNIARDVGEDAAMGRIYLPLSWFEDVKIKPKAFLRNPAFSPELGELTRRLLEDADRLYARARAGIAHLPLSCRPAIFAAAIMYREIGCQVARQGYDSISSRAYVPGRRKALLLARACAAAVSARAHSDAPPLAETRYLVEAVCGPLTGDLASRSASAKWWQIGGHIEKTIEIVHRLEERDAARLSGHLSPPVLQDER